MRNENYRFPEGGCKCKRGSDTFKLRGCTGSGSLIILRTSETAASPTESLLTYCSLAASRAKRNLEDRR